MVLLTQTEPAATILIDFPGQKVLFGDAATSDLAATAQAVVDHMISTLHTNEQWAAQW